MNMIARLISYVMIFWIFNVTLSCKGVDEEKFLVTPEFEQQEYIWLSWVESGFLGGDPFYQTILNTIKEIHPYVKVKILYGPQLQYNKDKMKERIVQQLVSAGVDTSRISYFYFDKPYGAIQDPGPIFLRNKKGALALADFNFNHPVELFETIDKAVAREMKIPTLTSEMITEGGAWQTDGRGTMLLVESVELDRNKNMDKSAIEKEYRKVLGVTKFIWLKNGLKEEEWGKLENGMYGIGTSGHIDEFCRFVDSSTVILTMVDPKDTIDNAISRESYHRMGAALEILQQSTNANGEPLKVLRLIAGPLMTKKLAFADLSNIESTWFEQPESDSISFYLATGYMNFVIANDVIVTAKYWKEGLSDDLKTRDELAIQQLQAAFPKKKIVAVDCMPLHHDGAGLHCHSRHQPFSGPAH
jgi:agmatine deiminase